MNEGLDMVVSAGHSPLRDYTNKVDTKVCPECGRERAMDWFVSRSDLCLWCREKVVVPRRHVNA